MSMLNERLLILNLREVKSVSFKNHYYRVYLNINYYNGESPFVYEEDLSDLAHKDYQVEKVRKVYEAIAESIKKGESCVEISL